MRFIFQLALIWYLAIDAEVLHADDWAQFGGNGRDFVVEQKPIVTEKLNVSLRWQKEVGAGKSSIVVADNTAIVSFRVDLEQQKKTWNEAIAAFSLKTGEKLWEYSCEVTDLKKQESFSGDPRAPQATPAIHENFVVALGFTGHLICLDRTDGTLVWEKNLVADQDILSKPVQFGYSASPVFKNGRLFVYAGGKSKSLIEINPRNGDEIWSVKCGEATYATPTFAEFEGTKQIVLFTRQKIIGFSESKGNILWQSELPEQGLTNVSVPLSVGDNRILVSGQGVGGTLCLKIAKTEDGWTADQLWLGRSPQMFYTNWIASDDNKMVFGCTENLLVALETESGKRTGRWRGFGDGNLLRIGGQLLSVSGKGQMGILEIQPKGLNHVFKQQLVKERVWAMPTLVDNQLLIRDGKSIYCFEMNVGDGTTNEMDSPKLLEYMK